MAKNNVKKQGENRQDIGDKKDTRFGYGTDPKVGKDTQFGGTRGNKRGHGFWDVKDTPRYKLEKMMTLSEKELKAIAEDDKAPYFERKIARCLKGGDWRTVRDMIHEVYGNPENRTELKMSGGVEGIKIVIKDCTGKDEKSKE